MIGQSYRLRVAALAGDDWLCVDCGETFSVRVVHCPHDDHHYPKEDGECSNCHSSLARLRQAEKLTK